MDGIPASFLDLEKARKQEEIVRLTASQVQKDFATFGIEIHFSGNPGQAFAELSTQLTSHLEQLIQNDYTRLKALLYQVDVNEVRINNALPGEMSYAVFLAGQILDREFFKVLTRLYFKQQSESPGNSNNTIG